MFAALPKHSAHFCLQLDSPDDKKTETVVRLPGIREDVTPLTPAPDLAYSGGISLVGAVISKSPPSSAATTSNKLSLQTPNTPRIDISRASSSSHHEEDSRDSSPERELFEGQDPASAKLGLGFREEGTKLHQYYLIAFVSNSIFQKPVEIERGSRRLFATL